MLYFTTSLYRFLQVYVIHTYIHTYMVCIYLTAYKAREFRDDSSFQSIKILKLKWFFISQLSSRWTRKLEVWLMKREPPHSYSWLYGDIVKKNDVFHQIGVTILEDETKKKMKKRKVMREFSSCIWYNQFERISEAIFKGIIGYAENFKIYF